MKNIMMKKYLLVLLLIASIIPNTNAQALKTQNEIIMAYYGRPGVSSLGVLGQHSATDLLEIIKSKCREYGKELPGVRILPAYDIIYGLAAAEPGADGDYIIDLSHEKLQPYLDLAAQNKCMVFIDLQLGKRSPLEAVKPVLHYLKQTNVHLAIDPEFEVKGINKRPGQVIGTIDGSAINEVQDAMRKYIKDNNIGEEKYLVVHMFTQHMVTNKAAVRDVDGINLIMNLDGHGPPHLKIDIYNGLYTGVAAQRVSGGFKLFFKEDHPLMTVRQVLGLDPVNGVKIKEMPRFINYQ